MGKKIVLVHVWNLGLVRRGSIGLLLFLLITSLKADTEVQIEPLRPANGELTRNVVVERVCGGVGDVNGVVNGVCD